MLVIIVVVNYSLVRAVRADCGELNLIKNQVKTVLSTTSSLPIFKFIQTNKSFEHIKILTGILVELNLKCILVNTSLNNKSRESSIIIYNH